MGRFEEELDRWITGNCGEDQFAPLLCPNCNSLLSEDTLFCASCGIAWVVCRECGELELQEYEDQEMCYKCAERSSELRRACRTQTEKEE